MSTDAQPAADPLRAERLKAAVSAGILSAEQAEKLSIFLAGSEEAAVETPRHPDDEALRFITSFNDIFVALGIALFLGPILYFLSDRPPFVIGATVAGLSWLLAEVFTRRRRMAFPSILLLLIFTVSVFLAFGAAVDVLDPTRFSERETAALVAAVATLTACLVALHWWRFRVPITIAAGVGVLCLMLMALFAAILPFTMFLDWVNGLALLLGLGVFALAMHFDMGDRARLTRRTDIAFWLHLLAAPMIVHAALSLLLGAGAVTVLGLIGLAGDTVERIEAAQTAAPWVLTVLGLLSIVALIIDRRALLVAGLTTAGVALNALIAKASYDLGDTPLTLFALGVIVLLLSLGWRPLRALLLAPLPEFIRSRVPPAT